MFPFKSKDKKPANSVTINFSLMAPVLFHKDCNGLPEHGKLCAEHATLNVSKSDGVRFHFDGIEPPQMTAEVLAYITDQAERQGYIVHYLHSYVNVLNQLPAPVLRPRSATPAPVLHASPNTSARGHNRSLRKPAEPTQAAAA
jgi:hypothetical protein